ncbi:MAG: 1-(5-phosphoribosyl)-5-[(5-phosphoribosylamino)methylideneamino]imidazole-4-carboxamide isomerase [Verrucomicrobia bacterium]|nr:1-(5-phosphoribosyl)-5-[(5-phosphoribosylamino)methylideneamino]imidazole-4-carboxamide isomerase [Verrucomicrobiota bacterium]
MILFPAIDLKGGRVVRLAQGRADKETVYSNDPAEPAKRFRDGGASWLHVVDLDGAFTGEQANARAVQSILREGLKVELGGGIRTVEAVRRWIDCGVQRVIIGTQAVIDPDFLRKCLESVPAERLAVGIDARDGKVAVRGWIETVDKSALDFAKEVEAAGIPTLIHTDISTDGMMTGPNLQAQEAVLRNTGLNLIASGGVSSLEDLRALRDLAVQYPQLIGVISGKAVYDGKLPLEEAFQLLA